MITTSLLENAPATIVEVSNDSRVALLTLLTSLPGSALLTPREAAAYLSSTAEVLRVWRHRGKGPRFCGRGHFIRYKKSDLDGFMRGFDHRFSPESKDDA